MDIEELCYSKLCQSDEGHPFLERGLVVHSNFSWHVMYCTAHVLNSDVLAAIPSIITSVSACKEALHYLDTLSLYCGNPDEKFITLAEFRKGIFTNSKFSIIY